MKKIASVLAICAAGACLLGVSGCATASSGLSVDSYWYIDSYEGIQRTSVLDDPENAGRTPESLLYEIKFDEESGGNGAYKIEYNTDSENFAEGDDAHFFRTVFYAEHYDWADVEHEEYAPTQSEADELPEEDKQRMDGTAEVVYVLETEARISGTYVFIGNGADENAAENRVEFTDYMITKTYFRSARNGLQPVYSKQEVHTTSPAAMSPTSPETMCEEIEYTYEVWYNFECTEAYYEYVDKDNAGANLSDTVTGLQNSGHTLFDNNTLYTVIRGFSLSENFGTTISLMVPANSGIVNVNVIGATKSELDTETDADIISALTAAYGQPEIPEPEEGEEGEGEGDGEEGEEEQHSYLYYNPVSIRVSGNNLGVTQTAWFASVEDEDNNTYRATMLRLTVPMSYALGTLEYRLAEVESVLGETA